MSCRCRDIRNCIHDIDSITEIISYLNKIRQLEESVSEEYYDLSMLSRRSFITDNMAILNNKRNQLNEPIKEIIPEFIKKCDDKISSLNRELSSMRSEDRRYHKKH